MWRRVSSMPDYQWPRRWMSVWAAPWRWVQAAIFNVARFSGQLRAGNSAKAVLAIRTDGIGDAILFEPALASLKKRFADHRLVLWATESVCELFSNHPDVDEIHAIPRGAKAGNLLYFRSIRWRAVLGWRLGRSRFDVAIYAVASPEPLGNWILRSVQAREKWYSPGDLENQFDWQREKTVSHTTRWLEPLGEGHELIRNAHLASHWGQRISRQPRVHAPPHSERIVEQWQTLARSTGASKIVGIMAGSATKVNEYPIEGWVSVIDSLWKRQRALCVLFGSSGDADRVHQITGRLRDIPWSRLPQGLGVSATVALLPFLDGFISMDTGLAHAAVSQGVPTVVLSNGGHPGRFFPWPGRTSSIVLNHPMPCEGCLCRCALEEPECVTRISPERVVEAYTRLRSHAIAA